MNLVDKTISFLKVMKDDDASLQSWRESKSALDQAVSMCQDPTQLEQAIKLDVSLHLPFQTKTDILERWIALAGRKPSILREYAWHLLLHGPDWDELAESLLREADSIDGQV